MTSEERPFRLVRVVLDTNLLVSNFVSRIGAPYRLMQRWYEADFLVVVSSELLAEYRSVLARPNLISKFGLDQEEIDGFFEALTINGVIVEPARILPIEVRDVKDERVLAAALDDRADYLVTGDNDLLTLADDPRLGNLRIVTARAFLDLL